ncbi:hypothetical protein L7F22_033968 [Adiantum nelumboides]|nr:hypothetical protein [Adiantum nelumboides]
MKVETCAFSQRKIYPGKGKLYVRGDSKVFRFVSSKNESLFLQRKNPRKIAWTIVYRRMHKKGITEEIAKKRSRKTVKHQRGIVGASLDSIAARRNQNPRSVPPRRLRPSPRARRTRRRGKRRGSSTRPRVLRLVARAPRSRSSR